MTQIYDFLREVRAKGDNPTLVTPTTWNRDLSLARYQRVGASHLLGLKRFVLGDSTGTGKTPTAIFAWGLHRDRYPGSRLIVPTTTSAVTQWAEEIARFLPGVRSFEANEDAAERKELYQDWVRGGDGTALILSWNVLLRDHEILLDSIDQWASHTWIVGDEIQKLKSPRSQLYKMMTRFCSKVDKVQGLTATLVKNKAHDAFHIFNLLIPGVMDPKFFEARYCLYGKRRVPLRTGKGGGRIMVPVKHLEGYRDLDEFAHRMSNFYLARTDEELDLERPQVRHMIRSVEMTPAHRQIYRDSEQGLFVEGALDDPQAARSALAHAQIAASSPEHYCDRVINVGLGYDLFDPDATQHPGYDKIQKSNAKLSLLRDLLEGEIEDDPVIVYSPFSSTVGHLAVALRKYHPAVITGQTSPGDRDKARHAFQAGETDLILITDAGGEALNLQRAAHIVMVSRPWDPGRYVQVVGRARRFGSDRKFLCVWHLTARDSVDELVDSVLESKLGGFEAIVKNATSLPQSSSSLPLEVVRRMRQKRIRS